MGPRHHPAACRWLPAPGDQGRESRSKRAHPSVPLFQVQQCKGMRRWERWRPGGQDSAELALLHSGSLSALHTTHVCVREATWPGY